MELSPALQCITTPGLPPSALIDIFNAIQIKDRQQDELAAAAFQFLNSSLGIGQCDTLIHNNTEKYISLSLGIGQCYTLIQSNTE